MLKIIENSIEDISKSNIEPNIFARLRLIPPLNRFDAVIIYDRRNRARIAMSWNMIAHINSFPREVWRENEWLISFWGTYIYNWNNDSHIRNIALGSERRNLVDIWFWLISSFTGVLGSNAFYNLHNNNPTSSGVYLCIELDEDARNPEGETPRWEIWNNQFNLDNCY